jgi:hypothetical protein
VFQQELFKKDQKKQRISSKEFSIVMSQKQRTFYTNNLPAMFAKSAFKAQRIGDMTPDDRQSSKLEHETVVEHLTNYRSD